MRVGIGDQKADMFSDPRFVALGIRYARIAVGWDVMTTPWELEALDTWLQKARVLNVQPLISIGHSRTQRRSLPTPERLRYEFRTMRERFPWVKTYATWNEENHCGEPVCHRPQLVASYYRALRRECPSCTILAPRSWTCQTPWPTSRRFARARVYAQALGRAQLRGSQPLQDDPPAPLLKALPGADVWLTETGGLVRRDNGGTTDIPEGPKHAGEVTRYLFDRVLALNKRIRASTSTTGTRPGRHDIGLRAHHAQRPRAHRAAGPAPGADVRPATEASYRSPR